MNNQSTQTATRCYPRRPEPEAPVFLQKTIDAKKGIELLNEFVREARKEIRKRKEIRIRKELNVSTSMVNADCEQLTFANSEMSITIDFMGGMAL